MEAAARAPSRAAARFVQRRLFSSGGKVLGEEEKAAENVYIKVSSFHLSPSRVRARDSCLRCVCAVICGLGLSGVWISPSSANLGLERERVATRSLFLSCTSPPARTALSSGIPKYFRPALLQCTPRNILYVCLFTDLEYS
jgi:hypothetical protein